jgi:hypothetical protein
MRDRLSVNAHIRLTEDLIREIRALADLEHRPIQDQMRYMLVVALQILRGGVQAQGDKNGRATKRNDAQMVFDDSRDILPAPPAPPIAANRSAMTQKRRSA